MLAKTGLADDDSWGGAIGGFAAEVALDPMTYLSLGASAVGKAGKAAMGAGLTKNTARAASKAAGKKVGRTQARLAIVPRDLIEDAAGEAVKSGRARSRGAEEAFASGFERYLKDGFASTDTLKGAFEQFKQWLASIYRAIRGTPAEAEVLPQLKCVSDRMLAGAGAATQGEATASVSPLKAVAPAPELATGFRSRVAMLGSTGLKKGQDFLAAEGKAMATAGGHGQGRRLVAEQPSVESASGNVRLTGDGAVPEKGQREAAESEPSCYPPTTAWRMHSGSEKRKYPRRVAGESCNFR